MDPQTADLTELVREFLSSSPLSQEDLAHYAEVSLKSVNNVHRGEHVGETVDGKLRGAITALINEGQAGAFGLPLRVRQLEERLAEVESRLVVAVDRLVALNPQGD